MILQKVAIAIKSYISPINTSTSSTQNNTLSDKKTVRDGKKQEDSKDSNSNPYSQQQEAEKQDPSLVAGPVAQSTTTSEDVLEEPVNASPSSKTNHSFSFIHLFQSLIKPQKAKGSTYQSITKSQKKGSGIKKGAIIDHKIE